MSGVREIRVELGARSYPICIGTGLLGDGSRLRPFLRGRALVVSNEVVAPLYLGRVRAMLGERPHAVLVLPDGEANKTLGAVQQVFEALAALGAQRDACVLALGGGVVGDTAGFAAACWMRGIDFVQLPTTLLAMVDAAVGGKTAVNISAGKNLVGAFHQPRAVLADTGTLATLPQRVYACGLAEAVKHAAIGDARFFARLEAMAEPLVARDPAALAELIGHACRFKAAVVARDETEHGERALLNFGHTFGHALETETGYTELLHGEAVAIGMCLATRLSSQLGMAPQADGERLAALLARLGLPVAMPPGLDPEALLAHMRLDKKNQADRLRLILWHGLGRAAIVDGVESATVRGVLVPGPGTRDPGPAQARTSARTR
ncbi:MAG TPA: 3-dehydroquinate synthase [Rhodanobacteraceae bacterium]|nr:3-dehydroquinate synthase [Rhodanobacteraceae bacterium]